MADEEAGSQAGRRLALASQVGGRARAIWLRIRETPSASAAEGQGPKATLGARVSNWAPPAPETPGSLPQAPGGWGGGPSNGHVILHHLWSW